MKNNTMKFNFKDKLISALIIAPTLAVMLISAVYQIFASQSGLIKSGLSISMSVLTAVSIAAGIVLAVLYSKEIVPIIYALLFGLGFICYLVFTLSGTTDVAEDAFFEMMMLIFSLPLMSFMSIPPLFEADREVVFLVLSGLITVVSIASAIYIVIKDKKELERKKNEEKAKAEMPDSRRRKVR